MIVIDDLIVTQCNIRKDELKGMVQYAKDGGVFALETMEEWSKKNRPNRHSFDLIQISRFPDGLLYIHDGHNRVSSMFLAGRRHIYKNEYNIKDWEYSSYEAISFANNWLTPFDIKTEVRLGDFYDFKQKVWAIYDNKGPRYAYDLIKNRGDLYKIERNVFKVSDFFKESKNG